MHISEIEQFRLEKAVRQICSNRNRNIPAELGKAQYEMYSEGVLFSQLSFLLDSAHCNAEITTAKLEYDSHTHLWGIYVVDKEAGNNTVISWVPYPHLPEQTDFVPLLHEIEQDPYQMIW